MSRKIFVTRRIPQAGLDVLDAAGCEVTVFQHEEDMGLGTSELMAECAHLSLADLRTTTDLLLRAGVTIDELNCVRKHFDQLKGGRLARLASPARVLALVLSDVVGDRLDVIASGPVSPDSTAFADALAVVDRCDLRRSIPASVRRHLESAQPGDESPGDADPILDNVKIHIVGSNRIAAEAVLAEAERRGYAPRLLSTTMTGEAREVGENLVLVGRC